MKTYPRDTLFVYTDGANTLYGTDRMLDALERSRDRTPEELLWDRNGH